MRKTVKISAVAMLAAACFRHPNKIYPESEEFSEETRLPKIVTYITRPLVEQKSTYTKNDIESSCSESITSFLESKGIQLLSYGTYGLESKPSIRGFTDETVRVVMDGICMNNPQYGTFDFSSINLHDVEKIEVTRGGFTEGIEDEGAVGGVIYITTKKQSLEKSFESDTGTKTFFCKNHILDTLNQSLGFSSPMGENTFLKLSLKGCMAKNGFRYRDFNNEISEQKDNEVKDAHFSSSISHYFGNGNSFSFSEKIYAGDKNISGPENSSSIGNQKDLDSAFLASISFPEARDSLSLSSQFSWISSKRNYEEADEKSTHKLNMLSFSAKTMYFGSEKINQSAGINFQAAILDSTNDSERKVMSATAKETTKIFMNDVFSLCIPLGFKIQGKNMAFTPKIGIKAEMKFLDLMLSAYRMVQFPNMDDLYWNDSFNAKGNPDLENENGYGAEFTINAKNEILPFSFAAYTNYYEKKIQWSYTNQKWMPENVSSAFYLGFDFMTEKRISSFYKMNFNAEYLHTKLLDKKNRLTYGKKIMWTPDFVFSIGNEFNFRMIDFSIGGNYTGKRYVSNLNVSFLEPYFLLNASARIKCSKTFTPYVNAENILCTDYESVENYPMPLASVTVGVKIGIQSSK